MSKKYGCNSSREGYVGRQDSFYAMDGYEKTMVGVFSYMFTPRFVGVENRMSKDCRYDRIEVDVYCDGCKWKKGESNE